MIKRIITTIILVCFVGMPIFVCTTDSKQEEIEVIHFPYNPIEIHVSDINIEETQTESEDIYTQKCNELLAKQEELSSITDKKEWFLTYKSLIDEYSEWCDSPESIYDYYNEELENEYELQLLYQVVESEATAGDFDSKCNVASVIFNRLNHVQFEDSLSDILVGSQFSCISDGRYKKVEVTEETILACEYAFMIEDTTDGCLYFESGSNNIHSSYADYKFEDSVGHKFYTERN